MRGAFSGLQPVDAFRFGDRMIKIHEVPGLRAVNIESQIKIDNLVTINQKYERLGSLVQYWGEQNGVRRPLATGAQAGLKFTKLVERGLNTYNRFITERVFEGVTAYTQLRFLQIIGQQQAELAFRQGLTIRAISNTDRAPGEPIRIISAGVGLGR